MSQENFRYWKELVGLDDTDFPQLIEISETNIDRANIVQTRQIEILNSIAANEKVDVQVQPGWGATTLFRFLENHYKKDGLTLLISFDFEQHVLDAEMTEEDFVFLTKWKLADGIANMMRERPMQRLYMYDVFDFEDTGETPWVGHLRKKRRILNDCILDPERFYREFPFFTRHHIEDCINYFLTNFQINCTFLYLFPRKVDEDALLELVAIIKNLYDGKSIAPAAMREVYICTPKLYGQINAVYARPFCDISYSRYSSAEIYSMLVSTYSNDYSSFTTVNDVFSEDFIAKAYDKKLTMKKIMERVKKEIIDCLDGPTSTIPYKLTLSKSKDTK